MLRLMPENVPIYLEDQSCRVLALWQYFDKTLSCAVLALAQQNSQLVALAFTDSYDETPCRQILVESVAP